MRSRACSLHRRRDIDPESKQSAITDVQEDNQEDAKAGAKSKNEVQFKEIKVLNDSEEENVRQPPATDTMWSGNIT